MVARVRRHFHRRALRSAARPEKRSQRVEFEPRIPDVQDRHLGVVGHVQTVRRRRREHGGGRVRGTQMQVPRRQNQTRREALDVPLPRTGKRFVKVVDVEDETALGRREAAEVHQVAVAAELHAQAGRRRRSEIRSHDVGRAAVERERRERHATVTNRHEFRNAPQTRSFEQRHRVGAVRRGLPRGVRRARDARAQRFAGV